MDPLTIIGLAGSVISIADVVAKSLSTLKNLQARWQSADWTITAIIGQLTTLKAALNHIGEWISTDLAAEPQHYQLVLDLEEALRSCKTLILFIDGHLSRLEWKDDDSLTYQSRLKATLGDNGIKDCMNHLHNQSSALNLLLTALNCRLTRKQKSLLEARETRRVFDQVKDDTSSLICSRDSVSFNSSSTHSTGCSSLISRIFTFDPDLLSSKVYQKQLTSLMKKAVRTPSRTTRSSTWNEWKESRLRSEKIESQLQHDKLSRRNECCILLQGSNNAGLMVMGLIKGIHGGQHTHDERLSYRERLQTRTVESILSFLTFVQSNSLQPDVLAAGWEANLYPSAPSSLRSATLEAIDTLWKDCNIIQHHRESRFNLDPEKDIHLLDSFKRILDADYCPTVKDVIIFNFLQSDVLPITSFIIGEITYRIICPNIQKIPRQYGYIDSIHAHVHVVALELANRDKPRTENVQAKCLEESFRMLESVVNHPIKNDIVLLLDGITFFKEELTTVPLSHHFPDYKGGKDYATACDYLLARFTAIISNDRRQVYNHFWDSTLEDPNRSVRFVMAAINDVTIQKSLSKTF